MFCLAHHILSPLANGSMQNWQAVYSGKSALRIYANHFASVEPFCASLFDTPRSFTELCIESAQQAIAQSQIDPTSQEVIFVVSTTKGDNLQLLQPAKAIAAYFKNPNTPIVVSNACISGVSAQIAVWRLLQTKKYTTAVVIGCDVQSQFIVSGFQSFKALSPEPCRPFDQSRIGLNLGEAVATMIWSNAKPEHAPYWQLTAGSMHNDANHISGPSRTGEGSYRCLMDVLQDCDTSDISAISVHGTATPYNDEMEAIAISRVGMQHIPIMAFKGYYGHTMGAAGLVETILTMLALEHKTILANPRYKEVGTTHAVNISAENRMLDTNPVHFIKLLSGFGGCNAAIRLTYSANHDSK